MTDFIKTENFFKSHMTERTGQRQAHLYQAYLHSTNANVTAFSLKNSYNLVITKTQLETVTNRHFTNGQ